MIAGVCAGLAARFAIPTWLVRLIFIVSVLLPGTQVIVYAILWILMPGEGTPRAGGIAPPRR
jgi:phage shock protein PspC (stress-responsive transcriptional regulator)